MLLMKTIASFKGINAYHLKWIKGAVCLPGVGIFINKDLFSNWFLPYVLQHEYGHYLDYKYANDLKPFPLVQFYFRIGIPSLFNAATGIGGSHKTYWTELRANRMAEKYLGDKLMKDYVKYFPTSAMKKRN